MADAPDAQLDAALRLAPTVLWFALFAYWWLAARAYPQDQTGMVAGIGSGALGAFQAAVLPIYGHWFDQKSYELTWSSMIRGPDV